MSSKWWVALLVASLALDLVLVGFFAGRQANAIPGFDPTMRYPVWARTLPEERRNAVRPTIKEHIRVVRPFMHELRGRYTQLRDSINAEPFDRERLEVALGELRGGLLNTQEISHDAFVSFVEQLTLAERNALARDLMRKPNRPKSREHAPRPPAQKP